MSLFGMQNPPKVIGRVAGLGVEKFLTTTLPRLSTKGLRQPEARTYKTLTGNCARVEEW